MLNTISWHEFLFAVTLFAGSYYAVTTLLLYTKNITARLKTGKHPTNHHTTGTPAASSHPEPDLIGTIQPTESEKQDSHKTTVNTDELHFPPGPDIAEDAEETTEAAENHNEALLITLIADLLQEVKSLTQVIAECNGTKNDSAPMFHALLQRYPQLRGTHYQDAVNLFITATCKEQCSFEVHPNEVHTWWTKQNAL